jgi:hypothetical protein
MDFEFALSTILGKGCVMKSYDIFNKIGKNLKNLKKNEKKKRIVTIIQKKVQIDVV